MVRGNGPWSPRGRVGLRKERGLFIPFNRRQVRASVDGRKVGGPVYGWRGDVIFLDSHLPVDISAWECCCNSNSTFPRGMLLFPSPVQAFLPLWLYPLYKQYLYTPSHQGSKPHYPRLLPAAACYTWVPFVCPRFFIPMALASFAPHHLVSGLLQ